MRKALALVLVAFVLAGFSARGSKPDYFGYTKKAICTGTFDLAAGPDGQRFFVDDGSIRQLKAQVWINATKGGTTVAFTDTRQHEVWNTTTRGTATLPVDLGERTLHVAPSAGPAGSVGVVVLRG